MGGMTIRFLRTNPLMERGEKRSGKGVRAIGVFSHLSQKIGVFGSRVRVRCQTGLRTLTEIPLALLAIDNPS
jgi:hypothetical protein